MNLFGNSKVRVDVVPDLNQARKALQDNAKPDDPPWTVIWLDMDEEGNIISTRKENLLDRLPKRKGKQ